MQQPLKQVVLHTQLQVPSTPPSVTRQPRKLCWVGSWAGGPTPSLAAPEAPYAARGYSRCVLEFGAALVAIVLLTAGLRLIVLWANDVQSWNEQERDPTDWL